MNISKLKRIPNQQNDLDERAFEAVKKLLTDVKSRNELNMVESNIKNLLVRFTRNTRNVDTKLVRVYSSMLDVLLYNNEIILEDIEQNA